ncbi:MAG: Hsp20/alpha crystallin family protein [Candidatus Heimdallarchaeota archaeon]|nr:MAG: Hsp20/alpha crystallin family protein [Candidatus Heimdallarchaeota archaeon]
MKDKTDKDDEDRDFHFVCDFPQFHVFWKHFLGKKPYVRKGGFFDHYGSKIHRGIPVTQIEKDTEKYTITVELPGIKKDEVNLEATNDELWLSARSEKFDRTYQHHLYFKKPIRSNEMKARLSAGILTIYAPFLEKVPKTKVDIE